MFGFMSLDPASGPLISYDGLWSFDNATLSQIQRGSYSYVIHTFFPDEQIIDSFFKYVPPPLELYTNFSQRAYFLSFWCLQFAQIAMIFLFNKLWLEKNCITLWEGVLDAIKQSYFPFPHVDWAAKNGSCLDHIWWKKAAQKQILIIIGINLLFNMIMLIPLVILCKSLKL